MLDRNPNVFYRARLRNIRWTRELAGDREEFLDASVEENVNKYYYLEDKDPGNGTNDGLPEDQGVCEERVDNSNEEVGNTEEGSENTGQTLPEHILNRYSSP